MQKPFPGKDVALQKMQRYCAFQERCHSEVRQKLIEISVYGDTLEEIIAELIADNYLNEERFASVFTLSKFHQKKWGKIRLKSELKARKISDYLIQKAVKEIPNEEYETTFAILSEKCWESINEKNTLKKRKKFCDYMLRKGWESDWVYEKVKEMEAE